MGQGIIKYKHWKTGEEEQWDLSHYAGVAHKTNLICPFDDTPILDREHYHNEHDVFCPNCGNSYSRNSTQEEINEQAKENVLRNKKTLKELEERKADLESKIKHAEEVGLI
jgi:uncharacterized Zn finger protein (UPF0148 family)